MIRESVRALCVLSVFCAAAMSIVPQGGARRIAQLLCVCALLLAAITPLRGIDLDLYALELAKNSERAAQIEKQTDTINRLVIQERYSAYIMDKAEQSGVALTAARIEVRWDSQGLWVPCSARLEGACTTRERELIASMLETQLGIERGAQEWSGYD